MKTLYLLRHATAAAAQPPAMEDFARTLSGLGVRQARTVGKFMKANRMQPDAMHISAAVRTTETAQMILTEIFGAVPANANFDKEIYNAADDVLMAAVRAADPKHKSLMLVAHNPGVSQLAFQLGKVQDYEPATLTVFTTDGNWSDFSANTVKLQKIFVPETSF